MAKTIAQLKREIAQQRKRVAKEEVLAKKISEKQKLSKELFELKNRKLIGAGATAKKNLAAAGSKAKKLSGKFGKALLKAGQKAAPIVKKQAKLIRDQQLRDDAIARKTRKPLKKKKKKSKKKKGTRVSTFSTGVNLLGGALDF